MAEAVKNKNVRVRFAPSPTGSLHIGGARTALFNWLFARKHGGKFILRIEDTDQVRSTRESEEGIIWDFQWFGLDWDEGPDPLKWPLHKGDKGPYRQTDRGVIYNESARKLLQLPGRRVYWCVCLEEELEAKRKAALLKGETPRYDGICYNRSEEELGKLIKEDPRRRRALRFHIPEDRGAIVVHDLVKGDISFDSKTIGDFVILKSHTLPLVQESASSVESGNKILIPSYNFACVIDDYLMEISDVIRGDEHLVNTPRQLLIYEAFGWTSPKYAHLPMILAPDHSKLSKRHGTTAVAEFRDHGFLPQALLNYVTLLGWSSGNFSEKETWSLNELIKEFSLDRISKNPAVFDVNKLRWFNGQYIREVSANDLRGQIKNISEIDAKDIYLPVIAHVAKKYVEAFEKEGWRPDNDTVLDHIMLGTKEKPVFLNDIATEVKELAGEPVFEDDAKMLLSQNGAAEVLEAFLNLINRYDMSTDDGFKACMKEVQVETGRKGKDLYMPVRAAVTGKLHGPELIHIIPVQIARFGKEGIANRIRNSLTQQKC